MGLGVLYIVWYSAAGRHWGENAYSVLTHTPLLGHYDSRDPSIIRQHLSWMQYAGFDFVVIDWFGPGTYEDEAARRVASECQAVGMPFCLMIDQVGAELGQGFAFAQSDVDAFAASPLYYRQGGRPVAYFFGVDVGYNLPYPYITRHFTGRLSEYLVPGYDSRAVVATMQEAGIPTVNPGVYIPRDEGRTYWRNLVAKASGPGDAVVFTWNDFHEGDAIEPTAEYGYQYLEVTRQWTKSQQEPPPTWALLALVAGLLVVTLE